MRRVLILLALLLACASPAAGQALQVRVTPDSIVADDQFHWAARIEVANTSERGLYVDSIVVVFTDQDPGQTGVARESRRRLLPMNEALSAGEASSQTFSGPATCEQGELRVRAWAHDGEKHAFTDEHVAPLRPNAYARSHPSRFLTSDGHRVEYVVCLPDSAPRASLPGLLVIPGRGAHARSMLPFARGLANHGCVVMALSQPGYGLSDGPADFGGPATVQAVSDAIDALRSEPGVNAKRVGVWGISRGAASAVGIAERRKDLQAVIAQSGSYDLWATYRETRAEDLRADILAQAGSDSAAWKARSPLLDASKVTCPLLILHGERDERAPPGPAHALEARLRQLGRPVEGRFFPQGSHFLSPALTNSAVFPFLEKTLGTR
jgi:dipeptidyl aminopeptidase/acylaminoacyl peptidase